MGWDFPCFCYGDVVRYCFDFGGFRLRFVNVGGKGLEFVSGESFFWVKIDTSVGFWRVGLFSVKGLRC